MDAEDFGGVVAAGVEIEAQFLSHVEMVLTQFAGYQRVDVIFEQVGHRALAAPGEDTDALGLRASVFDPLIRVREERL